MLLSALLAEHTFLKGFLFCNLFLLVQGSSGCGSFTASRREASWEMKWWVKDTSY
jgi:hypothetical protein